MENRDRYMLPKAQAEQKLIAVRYCRPDELSPEIRRKWIILDEDPFVKVEMFGDPFLVVYTPIKSVFEDIRKSFVGKPMPPKGWLDDLSI